jgi:hypothetical protein
MGPSMALTASCWEGLRASVRSSIPSIVI